MRALAKLTFVELKLFVREPVTLVFTLILPLIILIVMGEVFGKSAANNSFYRGVNAMDYYAPAYIGIVIAAIGLVAIPVHIAGYRERGILRRFSASSLSAKSLFSSQVAVSLLITAVCVCVLLLPSIFVYHIQAPISLSLVIGGSVLAMLSFITLGVFLGFLLPSARAAQGVGIVLFFFMFMIPGAGPPRAAMSPLMQDVGQVMPVWHVTSLLQDAWLGYGWNVLASLILTGILLLAIVFSFLVFKWE
jgi:ABC-2 type transport system permease protein